MIWNNVKTTHQRIMARFLRRRGWVVFYLDPEVRHCGPISPDCCWLRLYEEGEARDAVGQTSENPTCPRA
jgi:hypothetical protein